MSDGALPELLTVRLPAGTLRRLSAAAGSVDRAQFCRSLILAAVEHYERAVALQDQAAERAARVAAVETLIAPSSRPPPFRVG
jgi:hypothetical protein